jgi:predicted esterase
MPRRNPSSRHRSRDVYTTSECRPHRPRRRRATLTFVVMPMQPEHRSQLVFQTLAAPRPPSRKTVILLEGAGEAADGLVDLARTLGEDIELIVPNAPRFRVSYVDPPTMTRYWYVGETDARPDPTTFGDCLYQVEQFVLDVLDREGDPVRPVYLLGFDQGAVLALAAAEVIPDRITGVMAICGYLPEIPGWESPIPDLTGLPVLLVNDPDDEIASRKVVAHSRRQLLDEGAAVRTVELSGARDLGSPVEQELREWLTGHGTYSAGSNPNSGTA